MRTLTFSTFATLLVMGSLAAGCAAESSAAEGGGEDDIVAVKDQVHVPKSGSKERTAIVDGLHVLMDPTFKGQHIELVIGNNIHAHNGWAYIDATPQGVGGKKINWKATAYKDTYDTLDGGSAQAILREIKPNVWRVVGHGQDQAYVLFSGDDPMPYWAEVYAKQGMPLDIFPHQVTDATEVFDSLHQPALGTPERAKIVAGLHDQLDGAFNGQEIEFVLDDVSSHQGWAFVSGKVQAKGGAPIDWTKTDYAEAVKEGMFDGPTVFAVLREQVNGEWYVPIAKDGADRMRTVAVGPTDVTWIGWASVLPQETFGAPKDIFPSH